VTSSRRGVPIFIDRGALARTWAFDHRFVFENCPPAAGNTHVGARSTGRLPRPIVICLTDTGRERA